MSSIGTEKRETVLPASGLRLSIPLEPYQIHGRAFELVADETRIDKIVEMANFMNGAEQITSLMQVDCEFRDGFSVKLDEINNPKRARYSSRDNYHHLAIAIGTTLQTGEYTTEQLAAMQEARINGCLKAGLADYVTLGQFERALTRRGIGMVIGAAACAPSVGIVTAYEASPLAGVLVGSAMSVFGVVGTAWAAAPPNNAKRKSEIRGKIVDEPNLGFGTKHHGDLFSVPLFSLVEVK